MALDQSDKLALVALVVSLIALCNGFVQAAQQLLSTAQGYRNCKEEIIGPWSATRHRRWIWREFRYEVLYQTPEIMLLTDAGLEEEQKRRLVCFLNRVQSDPKSYRYRSIWRTLFGQRAGQTNAIESTAHSRLKTYDRKTWEQGSGPKPNTPSIDVALGSAVNWQTLVQVLHNVYTAYWPAECACSMAIGYSLQTRSSFVERRTTAAVAYRLQTWDFNPPEVVRPLALTTVGDIVVLVMRMGMTWRELQPGNARMQADGGGYNVTSSEIRGVGTVLRFGVEIQEQPLIAYIPSTDSDKMLCGILPVDTELIQKDHFELFDGQRKVPNILPILMYLSVEQSARDALIHPDLQKFIPGFAEVWRRTAFNDLIFFMAPFMPLTGCSAAYIGFRGFLSLSPTNCMTYWEARLALLYRLEQRTRNLPEDSKLVWICHAMQKFEKDFYGEFYSTTRASHADYYRTPASKPTGLPEYCNGVFQKTQRYFSELLQTKSTDHNGSLYCNLVSAHCSMAVPAALAARDRALPDHGKRRLNYSIHQERSPRLNMRDMYEIAWSYVDFVEQGKIYKDLQRQGDGHSPLSLEQAEEAWWMMVLRGMTWGFSVYICTTDHRPEGRVSIVPSYFWGNSSPVWLA
ncbi:hypothetical protein EV356DRAFT_514115 [Viridothelium virens]|uniref:Heterokaryon incompatibility domain-containing protein n=1 Tax=Viridothelium virens TaxID=1048519 RepID=A0A6A6HCM6_VIRVR|nr:hypothetical protein EV356DRAFT_514115 [Viridothelium virens]